jgi:copper chaperone CopZ
MMTRFTIPDMDCQGCVASITRAVQKLDQTATVRADLATHLVEIQSAQSSQSLAAVIDAAGYTVVEA